ncbi:MAG: hypothetical protein ACRD5J_10840, partial [Nitrososphaeraceae archaeon]
SNSSKCSRYLYGCTLSQLTNGTTEIAYYNGALNYSSEPGPLLDGLSYSCFKEVMMNEDDRV